MDLGKLVLSLPSILARIDEYELFCHYLGFDPDVRETYSSPLREGDLSPSFSFFEANSPTSEVEFMWKDNTTNKRGTIVHLIMEMYGLTFREVLKKIDTDFKLGFTDGTFKATEKIIKKSPIYKTKATIKVVSKYQFSEKGVKFWKDFGISLETLKLYNVTELSSSYISDKFVGYSNVLTFAYRIGTYYKLYSPYSRNFKFLNNFPGTYAEGFTQLKCLNNTLIITKSLKDVMVLHELGFEAISPKSETTVLPKEYFTWINEKYKRGVVLFDNDMKHNGDEYPYEKIYVPIESGCKDISDYMKKYGKKKTKWLVQSLLK